MYISNEKEIYIKIVNKINENQNSQRFFVPEEVGEVATFLLSDYSKCISGEIIHTNAGNHIRRGY